MAQQPNISVQKLWGGRAKNVLFFIPNENKSPSIVEVRPTKYEPSIVEVVGLH